MPHTGNNTQISFSRNDAANGEDIGQKITKGAETLYLQIEQAVTKHDTAAMHRVMQNPYLPEPMKAALNSGKINANALPGIHARLTEESQKASRHLVSVMKEGFTFAITKIYFISIFIGLLGWLATWFVPEYPLRKSNDMPVVMD
jgi:hypothetical protein